MTINVVILAAGQGKRMRSNRPKVLHALAGRPMIQHVIDAARALDTAGICVVYGHGGEQVLDALKDSGLAFVKQEPQLGTGHAVQQALPHLGAAQRTLVLYGDVPLIRPETLRRLVEAAGSGLSLLTALLPEPKGYGRIVRDAKNSITRIVEEKDATPAERAIQEVNTGFMVLPSARLGDWLGRLRNTNAQGEYYLTDVIALALADGVSVTSVQVDDPDETLGVNSRAQLAYLERHYQARIAAELLDAGVTLADPARIDVRGRLTCGMDVQIDVSCVFEGNVALADGVRIGPHCVIRNAEIGSGTVIDAFTHIEDARVGTGCRLGPYARLRPGAKLAEDVHIGNFVEVKASDIGAGSKANHLAYVGDSTVGRNVNVGAGTITCNYDGANKHRTVIEDDVFIGSDTQLVAPVTVRRGTTIAAGTTVWKDTGPEGLTFNAKSQEQRSDWQRPRKKPK